MTSTPSPSILPLISDEWKGSFMALHWSICPQCGGEKKYGSKTCRACWKLNVIQHRSGWDVCPDCGGPRSHGAKRCRGCRSVKYSAKSVCPDCGGYKAPNSTRCDSCYRALPAGKDGLCGSPWDCGNIVGPKGSRGWCAPCRSRVRNRRARLKRGQPVALFVVTPHTNRGGNRCVIPDRRMWVTVRNRLLAGQGGVCKMCGNGGGTTGWHLDHDHHCSHHPARRVCSHCLRGVLCHGCNIRLVDEYGADWYRKAAEYLDTFGVDPNDHP